jgi:hypothetical protein
VLFRAASRQMTISSAGVVESRRGVVGPWETRCATAPPGGVSILYRVSGEGVVLPV